MEDCRVGKGSISPRNFNYKTQWYAVRGFHHQNTGAIPKLHLLCYHPSKKVTKLHIFLRLFRTNPTKHFLPNSKKKINFKILRTTFFKITQKEHHQLKEKKKLEWKKIFLQIISPLKQLLSHLIEKNPHKIYKKWSKSKKKVTIKTKMIMQKTVIFQVFSFSYLSFFALLCFSIFGEQHLV